MSFSVTTRFLKFPTARGASREGRIRDFIPEILDPTDESLFELIREGDKDALALLFRRYARLVRSVASRILRNTEEAEDLVQDVFLYIFNKCKAFESSKSTARSWIVQITYHRAIDRRRYLAARRFYDQVDVDAVGLEIPSERIGDWYDQSIEAILGAKEAKLIFDSLSGHQQETLRLFFFEGYTFEEIAEVLQQTLGNVRNHYYRGLEKIRERVFSKTKGR